MPYVAPPPSAVPFAAARPAPAPAPAHSAPPPATYPAGYPTPPPTPEFDTGPLPTKLDLSVLWDTAALSRPPVSQALGAPTHALPPLPPPPTMPYSPVRTTIPMFGSHRRRESADTDSIDSILKAEAAASRLHAPPLRRAKSVEQPPRATSSILVHPPTPTREPVVRHPVATVSLTQAALEALARGDPVTPVDQISTNAQTLVGSPPSVTSPPSAAAPTAAALLPPAHSDILPRTSPRQPSVTLPRRSPSPSTPQRSSSALGISIISHVLPEVRSPRRTPSASDTLQIVPRRSRRPRLFGFTDIEVRSTGSSSAASSPPKSPEAVTKVAGGASQPPAMLPRRQNPVRTRSDGSLPTLNNHNGNVGNAAPRRRDPIHLKREPTGLKLDLGGIIPQPSLSQPASAGVVSSPYNTRVAKKKNGEVVRSALKYSGPLLPNGTPLEKRSMFASKSCPTTPSCPKYVHFDAKLEHVKLFLQNQMPQVVSRQGSPDMSEAESDEEDEEAAKILEIRLPNFPTAQAPDADMALESLFLNEQRDCLRGTLIVRNIAYEKWVTIRFTFDWWQTVSEVVATYKETIRNGTHDRFTFNIKLSDLLERIEEKTLFVCARYNTAGREIWDSNGGENYQVLFERKAPERPKKYMPKRTTQSSPKTGTGQTAPASGKPWSVTGADADRMADLRAKLNRLTEEDRELNAPLSPHKRSTSVGFTPPRSKNAARNSASPVSTKDVPPMANLVSRYDFTSSLKASRDSSPTTGNADLPRTGPSREFYSPRAGHFVLPTMGPFSPGSAGPFSPGGGAGPFSPLGGAHGPFSPGGRSPLPGGPSSPLALGGQASSNSLSVGGGFPMSPNSPLAGPPSPTPLGSRQSSTESLSASHPVPFLSGGGSSTSSLSSVLSQAVALDTPTSSPAPPRGSAVTTRGTLSQPDLFPGMSSPDIPTPSDTTDSVTSESPLSPPSGSPLEHPAALPLWGPKGPADRAGSDDMSMASYADFIEQFCWGGGSSNPSVTLSSSPEVRRVQASGIDHYFSSPPDSLTPHTWTPTHGLSRSTSASGNQTGSTATPSYRGSRASPPTREDLDHVDEAIRSLSNSLSSTPVEGSSPVLTPAAMSRIPSGQGVLAA